MLSPIIVDTDLSFDDYVALLYLLQHPGILVRAITVVNGVAHVKPGIENARRVLALVDHPEIPVAGGPEKPLSGRHSFPGNWRFLLDWGPRLFLPRVSAMVSEMSAPELILQQCSASDQPISFVALGPLTNLALALQTDPALARRIDMVYISSGAIEVPGLIHDVLRKNSHRVASWNLYLDVEATVQVFESGIPISLIPKDVTHINGSQPLLFRREFVRRLRRFASGNASQFMVRIIYWWQLMNPQYSATPIWDAVTAAVVAEPAVASEWRDLAIRIAHESDKSAGQTIVEVDQSANVRACMKGDLTIFEKTYLSIVRGESKGRGE
jgi:inosine-uridine nucleoside N-ribohydrolase